MASRIGRWSVLVCLLVADVGLGGQVRPIPPPSGQGTGTGVTPLPQRPTIGSVTPIVENPDPNVAKVFAIGVANVFAGNVGSARQAALQSAYAEAVSMGAGAEIGRLTVIRNVKAVTDVVSSRSRGFIRTYEVIGEQLLPGDVPRYEVRIRAEVIKSPRSEQDEVEGLKLFLEVIGSPKLLIMLPERMVGDPVAAAQSARESTQIAVNAQGTSVAVTTSAASSSASAPAAPADPEGGMRSAEAALAAAFSKYGYPVTTSDDLVAGGLVSAAQLSRARQGITADAIAVARAAGADLLLTGVMRTATQKVAPQGVEFISATTEASAKALVVSNGYVIDAFHKTVTKAHVSTLGAISMSLDAIAADFAGTLAWKIPGILSARPRVTRLIVSNVGMNVAERLKAALEKIEGIDVVRFASVPTSQRQTAEFELLTGYVMLPQDQLVNHCIDTAGPIRVDAADKFTLTLRLL